MKITFDRVSKRYGKTTAVRNLSLVIDSGALHFLLGPSGCGKTTTLRMLAGLETVSEGKIFFDAEDVTNRAASERGIGMVFQNYALWPHMTVLENIKYGLKLRKLPKAEFDSRIDDVLSLTQLTNFTARYPGQLSGGQQQRVALARALAIRPHVLLLDEPLSNLDAKLRLEMRDNIARIHRETKITTVYVTHDQKEALSMGTAITVMVAGDLIQTATPKELYSEPLTPFVANFIGETNLIEGKVKTSGAQPTISTGLGDIVCGRSLGNFAVGENVVVSVRPEHVLVRPTAPEVSNRYACQVRYATFLGEQEQIHFEKTSEKSSVRLRSTMFGTTEEFDHGQTVDIGFKPKYTLCLKPDISRVHT